MAKKRLYCWHLIAFWGIIMYSCSTPTLPKISFYYWKTVFNLSTLERETLSANKVNNLYIRYFDVDIDTQSQQPVPLSPIRFAQKANKYRVIPVIYIKNRVMLQEKTNLRELAAKIFTLIQQINKSQGLTCNEIQIDCDWTVKSRDNYLRFLEYFKTTSQTKISATIRLHQIKYFLTTKIPNVDRGILMYYNMGHIGIDSLNSIYDRNIANKYINSLDKYPLNLDIALPIYSWGVHQSNKTVISLISKARVSDFASDCNYLQQNSNIFVAKQANIKLGSYFKATDVVKIEAISPDELKEMAHDLGKNLRNIPNEIIFYDLDSTNLQIYKNEKQIFEEITHNF